MEEDKSMDVFEEDEHWKVSWLELGKPTAVTKVSPAIMERRFKIQNLSVTIL